MRCRARGGLVYGYDERPHARLPEGVEGQWQRDRACHPRPRDATARTHRPLGSGKTSRLRAAFHTCGVEPLWTTARDAAGEIVEALQAHHYEPWREAFVSDPRPLVVEHMEDLHGRTRTLEELRQVLVMRLSSR
jgi:hypothetical protein